MTGRAPAGARGSGAPAPLWAGHDASWRAPAEVLSHWRDASAVDPGLLTWTASGAWWDTLARTEATLVISREYEHLLIGLGVQQGRPRVTYLPLPHPSGLVADRARGRVYVASTRNPNQVVELAPIAGSLSRADAAPTSTADHPLTPVRTRFYPGCLYIHDLALVGGQLHANAVGQNAVVRLCDDWFERVWWPSCVDGPGGPRFEQNYIQLNSIASGDDLAGSFFSASSDRISRRRPGHRNFAVDRRGVIFAGATGQPIVRGLTRPHSARLSAGRLWVDNSGYGEVGLVRDGRFESVARLPGWTRGLAFHSSVAFVGTSRVIPRFRQYAPGLDVDSSVCGLHAVEISSGRLLGSLTWPLGNQLFAIDWLPGSVTAGFPFVAGARRSPDRERRLFYAYRVGRHEGET